MATATAPDAAAADEPPLGAGHVAPPQPPPRRPRRTRVCVLTSSYEGSDSATKAFDIDATPKHYFAEDDPDVHFTLEYIRKAHAFKELRTLVHTGKYDVFFNLCDGARDEDRAGEEVVRTLEELHVPFTGALNKFYEISKVDMKLMSHFAGIRTAPFAVVEEPDTIRTDCSRLRFPVIVKHVSGYASIGMSKASKCHTMAELVVAATSFIERFQSVLVEEFITGEEVTVLTCADPSEPDGIHVYHPVMMSFPPGEDFKHFDLKWVNFEGMQWVKVPDDDPALKEIMEVGRRAFKAMMGGVGYGRTDLRINRTTNEVYFLEINPNCGIMYPPGQEGSADWILKLAGPSGHREFVLSQIGSAIAHAAKLRPKFAVKFDHRKKDFLLQAASDLPKGTTVFHDEGRPFRLFTRQHVESTWDEQSRAWFAHSAWPLSTDKHVYAVWDTEPKAWRPFNHSCQPNLGFIGSTLDVATICDVRRGTELTMDYMTFCDDAMEPFECHCDADKCLGRVVCQLPVLVSRPAYAVGAWQDTHSVASGAPPFFDDDSNATTTTSTQSPMMPPAMNGKTVTTPDGVKRTHDGSLRNVSPPQQLTARLSRFSEPTACL